MSQSISPYRAARAASFFMTSYPVLIVKSFDVLLVDACMQKFGQAK